MNWDAGEPVVPDVYTEKLIDLLGPGRAADQPVERRHEDLAASVQRVFEEAAFHVLRGVHARIPVERLCLAGGCAMNSVANGKIRSHTPFKDVFIQPAAGDNGTALGAALEAWHASGERPVGERMPHAYWGTEYDADTIAAVIRDAGVDRRAPLRVDDAAAMKRRCARPPPASWPTATSSAGSRGGWNGARAPSAIAASSRIRAAATCAT